MAAKERPVNEDQSSLSRRDLLVRTAVAGGAVVLGGFVTMTPAVARAEETPVALPALPWADNALEPVISAKTISFHYGKHHKAYIDNVLAMTKEGPLAGKSLEA